MRSQLIPTMLRLPAGSHTQLLCSAISTSSGTNTHTANNANTISTHCNVQAHQSPSLISMHISVLACASHTVSGQNTAAHQQRTAAYSRNPPGPRSIQATCGAVAPQGCVPLHGQQPNCIHKPFPRQYLPWTWPAMLIHQHHHHDLYHWHHPPWHCGRQCHQHAHHARHLSSTPYQSTGSPKASTKDPKAWLHIIKRKARVKREAQDARDLQRRIRRDGAAAPKPPTQWALLPVAAQPYTLQQTQHDQASPHPPTPAAVPEPPAVGSVGQAGQGSLGGETSKVHQGISYPSAKRVWALSPRELTAAIREAGSVAALTRLLQPLIEIRSEGASEAASNVGKTGRVDRVNLAGQAAHEAIRRAGGLGVRGLTAAFNQLAWVMTTGARTEGTGGAYSARVGTGCGTGEAEYGRDLGGAKRQVYHREHDVHDVHSDYQAQMEDAQRLHSALCRQLKVVAPQLDLRGAASITWSLGKLRRVSRPDDGVWQALVTRLMMPHVPRTAHRRDKDGGGRGMYHDDVCLSQTSADELVEVALGLFWMEDIRQPLLWQAVAHRFVSLCGSGIYSSSAEQAQQIEPMLKSLAWAVNNMRGDASTRPHDIKGVVPAYHDDSDNNSDDSEGGVVGGVGALHHVHRSTLSTALAPGSSTALAPDSPAPEPPPPSAMGATTEAAGSESTDASHGALKQSIEESGDPQEPSNVAKRLAIFLQPVQDISQLNRMPGDGTAENSKNEEEEDMDRNPACSRGHVVLMTISDTDVVATALLAALPMMNPQAASRCQSHLANMGYQLPPRLQRAVQRHRSMTRAAAAASRHGTR